MQASVASVNVGMYNVVTTFITVKTAFVETLICVNHVKKTPA